MSVRRARARLASEAEPAWESTPKFPALIFRFQIRENSRFPFSSGVPRVAAFEQTVADHDQTVHRDQDVLERELPT